jgi:hypothetical protein
MPPHFIPDLVIPFTQPIEGTCSTRSGEVNTSSIHKELCTKMKKPAPQAQSIIKLYTLHNHCSSSKTAKVLSVCPASIVQYRLLLQVAGPHAPMLVHLRRCLAARDLRDGGGCGCRCPELPCQICLALDLPHSLWISLSDSSLRSAPPPTWGNTKVGPLGLVVVLLGPRNL